MRPYPRTAVPRSPVEFSLRPVPAVESTSASQPFRAVGFACFGRKRATAYNSFARRPWTLHLERQLTFRPKLAASLGGVALDPRSVSPLPLWHTGEAALIFTRCAASQNMSIYRACAASEGAG